MPLANNCTVLLASAVPVNVGVVLLVTLSLLAPGPEPLSSAVIRSGTEGRVSTMTLTAPDSPLVSPPSVWRAV